MKHVNKYIALGMLSALTVLCSCSDSWLDKSPTGSASAGEVMVIRKHETGHQRHL